MWATEPVSWIALQVSLPVMGVWIYLMHRHFSHEINTTLNGTQEADCLSTFFLPEGWEVWLQVPNQLLPRASFLPEDIMGLTNSS